MQDCLAVVVSVVCALLNAKQRQEYPKRAQNRLPPFTGPSKTTSIAVVEEEKEEEEEDDEEEEDEGVAAANSRRATSLVSPKNFIFHSFPPPPL